MAGFHAKTMIRPVLASSGTPKDPSTVSKSLCKGLFLGVSLVRDDWGSGLVPGPIFGSNPPYRGKLGRKGSLNFRA